MRSRTIGLVLVAVMSMPWVAQAASLQVIGGYLSGATGVEVNGRLYDVEFVEGSCASLFDGCDSEADFAFDQLAAATAASEALLSQVFVDVADGRFDSLPFRTDGCILSADCRALTPYSPGVAANVLAAYAFNDSQEAGDGVGGPVSYGVDSDTGQIANLVYARWTPAPEPRSLALFGIGLAALAAVRRWIPQVRSCPSCS